MILEEKGGRLGHRCREEGHALTEAEMGVTQQQTARKAADGQEKLGEKPADTLT